ncbi:unnamed protein product, partial [Polarella glacialis]
LYEASSAVAQTAGASSAPAAAEEVALLRQIRKDLPRMELRGFPPSLAAALQAQNSTESEPSKALPELLERVLFIWAVRQPASGYVQGLNEVLLPLVLVFLAERLRKPVELLNTEDLSSPNPELLGEVEADCYWCMSKILSEIFDHYTQDQPGIQRMARRLKEVLRRIDEPLALHLQVQADEQGIDHLQAAAYQWVTCLMVRELPLLRCLRLWDTLIAESALSAERHSGGQGASGMVGGGVASAGFEAFLVYFCACLLAFYTGRLQVMELEESTAFLKQLPTGSLSEADMEVLLAESYVLHSLFHC